jgi:hypothetical protein
MRASIADGEALPDVGRILELVDWGDCVVLPGDTAALVGGQKLILPEPEPARPLAGSDYRRRRQEGPFERLLLAQEIEEFAALGRFRFVRAGN